MEKLRIGVMMGFLISDAVSGTWHCSETLDMPVVDDLISTLVGAQLDIPTDQIVVDGDGTWRLREGTIDGVILTSGGGVITPWVSDD